MESKAAEVNEPIQATAELVNRQDFATIMLNRIFGVGNVDVVITDVSPKDVMVGVMVKHPTLPPLGGETQLPFSISEVEFIYVIAKFGLQFAFQFSKQLEAQTSNDIGATILQMPSSYKES